ncbi:hypothetical protein MHYP_G00363420 [Metynnis hypsauchen]
MAAEQQTRNRTRLLCPFCKKTVYSLPAHLRNTCVKESSEIRIKQLVDSAKKEAQRFLQHGRIWEFSELYHIMEQPDRLNRMIKELQNRGNVIRNLPPKDLPAASVAESSQSPESMAPSESSEEYYQIPAKTQSSTSKRDNMFKTGCYNKHSLDHPLLKNFSRHLEVELKKEKFKQEVDNVARFLYFMDPMQPSLTFVQDKEKIREYCIKLSDNGLTKQTVQNYMKSIKRFSDFHGPSITPKECWAVLDTAKRDFLGVLGKLGDPTEQPALPDLQLVLYYLEAIVILRHLQRPGVVTHMTVSEWQMRSHGRDGYAVVSVKEHKTAANQIANLSLTQEEEAWFDMYFTEVRPIMVSRNRAGIEFERFFISSTGKPIHNPSNDLERLHKKYNLPKITSQMVRKAFETATKLLNDSEKSLVADYLSHSTATAERHYRMRKVDNVVLGFQLLKKIADDSDSSSEGRVTHARPGCSKMTEEDACDLFMRIHPATVGGDPPEQNARVALVGEHERKCYHRWRAEQKLLRVKYISEHFGHRRPLEKQVKKFLERKCWTTNIPDASQVFKKWKPPAGVDRAMDSRNVRKVVKKQKWGDLQVNDQEGKGITTTRDFACGEVVCDFHGRMLSREEGLAMVNKETAGSLFFFEDQSGSEKCIDARQERCDCHSAKDTLGRLIRHSSKKSNVRPRLYSQTDGHEVVLFLATRDITKGEELRYDHGSKRKLYAGEGLDLHWT